MKTDRMTKVLLFLIMIALWGLLLKPLVIPTPAQATSGPVPVNIVGTVEVEGTVSVDGVEGSVLQLWPIKVRAVR